MKHLIIGGLLVFFTVKGFSQKVDRYRLIGKSAVIKDKDGEYLYQRAWVDCDYLAVMDMANSSLTMYIGKKTEIYSIVSVENGIWDKDSSVVFKMNCVDEIGNKCRITLITLRHPPIEYEDYREFIKLEYSDAILIYRSKEVK